MAQGIQAIAEHFGPACGNMVRMDTTLSVDATLADIAWFLVVGILVAGFLLGGFLLGKRVRNHEPPPPTAESQPHLPEGGAVYEVREERDQVEIPEGVYGRTRCRATGTSAPPPPPIRTRSGRNGSPDTSCRRARDRIHSRGLRRTPDAAHTPDAPTSTASDPRLPRGSEVRP